MISTPKSIVYSVLFVLQVSALVLFADEVVEIDTLDEIVRSVPGMELSMVEVRAARIEADHLFPWRNSAPSWHTGYGVAVEPGVFLASEVLVRNHTSIQIRRAGSVQPVPAQVILSDPRVGLALVAAEASGWFEEAVPLALLEQIPLDDNFTIVQWGENDHLQAGIGNLLSIGHESVGDGIPDQLTYQLASSLQVTRSGTPVLHGGKLAGMAMRSRSGRRAAVALSPDSITRFLSAVRQDGYVGMPEPDFEVIPLADPVRRRFLGVPADYKDQGVYVQSVCKDTHGLKPHDVILSWDGMALDARGNYQHPLYGPVPFRHLVVQRSAGDHVPATVVRDREIREVEMMVRLHSAISHSIPENTIKKPDDYVVAGGFVFRELTWDFLKSFGDNWQRRADIDLLWRAVAPPDREDVPDLRTVILVAVLADPINIGYRKLRFRIVNEINGHRIHNLMDLASRIDAEGFASVTLDRMDAVPIVFDPEEVKAADVRIRQRFQIPYLRRLSSEEHGR